MKASNTQEAGNKASLITVQSGTKKKKAALTAQFLTRDWRKLTKLVLITHMATRSALEDEFRIWLLPIAPANGQACELPVALCAGMESAQEITRRSGITDFEQLFDVTLRNTSNKSLGIIKAKAAILNSNPTKRYSMR